MFCFDYPWKYKRNNVNPMFDVDKGYPILQYDFCYRVPRSIPSHQHQNCWCVAGNTKDGLNRNPNEQLSKVSMQIKILCIPFKFVLKH